TGTPDFHRYAGAARRFGNEARQVPGRVDRMVTELEDDVARLDAGFGGGAAALYRRDERALVGVQAHALGQVRGTFLDCDAQPAAVDVTLLLQLGDDRFGKVRGNGEPDADRATAGRYDRGIDADHGTVGREGGTAGIALVDRGIDLQ